jgi:exosortase/archaeosortase family protein
LVALLAQLSQAKDLFGGLMRPVVLALLNAVGVAASDHGDNLSVGNLEVPWSRDCAGLNLLIILLAVAIWVNRNEPPRLGLWLRIAAMVPAAFFANIARVFTIIACRYFFYPGVESPQLHYFIGLVWLVPFAILVMPKDSRPRSVHIFELLHTAPVVALLSPMVDGPGGIALSIAVVFGLAHCRFPDHVSVRRIVAFAAWLLAAVVGVPMEGIARIWNRGTKPLETTVQLGRSRSLRLRSYSRGPLLLRRSGWLRHVAAGNLRLVGVLPRTDEDWKILSPDTRSALEQAPVGVFALSDLYHCHSAGQPDEWMHAVFQAGSADGIGQRMAWKSLPHIALTNPVEP